MINLGGKNDKLKCQKRSIQLLQMIIQVSRNDKVRSKKIINIGHKKTIQVTKNMIKLGLENDTFGVKKT